MRAASLNALNHARIQRKALGVQYGEEETDWFQLEMWNRDAEYAAKVCKKGGRIGVTVSGGDSDVTLLLRSVVTRGGRCCGHPACSETMIVLNKLYQMDLKEDPLPEFRTYRRAPIST